MPENITTVIDYPININVISNPPVNITVNNEGIQGPIGASGASASGSSSSVNLSGYITTGQSSGLFYSNFNLSQYSTSGDLLNLSGYLQSGAGNQNISNIVYTTGDQLISGNKIFISSLKDISNNDSIDITNRGLIDGGGSQSLDWNGRILKDGVQNYSIQYADRFLRDAAQNYVLDWNNRILSGNWSQNGNSILDASASLVTGISINGSSQHLTGYVTFSAGNNDITLGQNSAGVIISAPGIGITGSNLYNFITGLSGALVQSGIVLRNLTIGGDTNLSGNIYSTGSSLYNNIVSLSGLWNNNPLGYLNTLSGLSVSYVTGISGFLQSEINNVPSATSLYQTGSNLYGYLTGFSGVFNTSGNNYQGQINTLTANLQSSGSILYNDIISLSGIFNNTGITIQNEINILTNNLVLTGATLYNRDLSISGALVSQINASAAGVSTLNGLSGVVIIAGTGGNLSTFISGSLIYISGSGIATISNLSTTGSNLYNLIVGLSGSDAINYATISNYNGLSGSFINTGVAIESQINSLSGWAASAGNLAATGQQLLTYIISEGMNLSGNIYNTGSILYNLATGLSGQSNLNYSTINNLGLTGQSLYSNYTGLSSALQNTGSILYSLITAASGGSSSNGDGINLSGNLYSTGANLYNLITSLSGQDILSYAPINNLYLTGQSLYGNYTGLSGSLIQSGIALYNNDINLSGSLFNTGSLLQNKINALNGNFIVYTTGNQNIGSNNIFSGNNTFFDLYQSGIGYTGVSGLVFRTGQAARFYINDTGNNLSIDFYNRVLSGSWNSNNLNLSGSLVATAANLFTTGASAIISSNSNATNLSGRLTATGLLIINRNGDTTSGTFNWSGNSFYKVSGILGSPTDLIYLQNTTTGQTGFAVQYSPAINFSGNIWSSGISTAMNWRIYESLTSGNPPTSKLNFDSSMTNSPYANRMSLSNSGNLIISGNYASSVVIATGAYSLLNTNSIVLVDTTNIGFTGTFPNASGVYGSQFVIKDYLGNAASRNMIITGINNQTFDGSLSKIISTNYGSYTIISNGQNFNII